MDTNTEVVEKANPVKINKFENSLEFKNVDFFYENNEPVLKNVSLEIKKGEMVAIVGPSGAGKSTIADLISRFYDAKSGAIFFDGIDLRDINTKSLRNNFRNRNSRNDPF